MLIIPAIDLMNGQCVRLRQGVRATRQVYANNPAVVAAAWAEAGAAWIHVVNLDGAFGHADANTGAIASIVAASGAAVELGGGIRRVDEIAGWLKAGVARVILGTAAVADPELVPAAIRRFGAARIVVGVDARAERIAIRGWEEESAEELMPFIARLEAAGVERIIYTDIERDGVHAGPNLERLQRLAASTTMQVIASGGFSVWDHFERLEAIAAANIEGAIVGRALYEGDLDLARLTARFQTPGKG